MENKRYARITITFLKTVFFIGVLVILLSLHSLIPYKNQGIDLLKNGNWSHFPGATITKSGIHFQPLNRIIVHQDGSVGQASPPVDLSGQHLLVEGDFAVTATMSAIDQQASLRLYASPPIVYDQWRYETPSIDINVDVKNNLITARIFDGSSDTSMDIRTYNVSLPFVTTVSVEHIKNQITITKDGQVLGSMPDHGIFDSGTVWLGTDGAAKSNGWKLVALHTYPIGRGSVSVVSAPTLIVDHRNPNNLCNLADANLHAIKIGAALALEPLLFDQQYRNLALGQFSIITPENSMKPEFIHPESTVYDFTEADQLVGAALKNNIIVHGHALLYDKSSPDWMSKSNVVDRQRILVNHITTVVSHFKGRVAEWDVVNEPLSDKNALYHNGGTGLDQNIWFEAMKEKYIDLAFVTAHQADPLAKLYLNDYGLENDGQRWDAMLSLVKKLKKGGVPIDGVGFEAHIYSDGDYLDAKQLKNHMKILGKLGLLTRISEIDVTQDDAQQQINQYVMALDVCLGAPNCTSYTTWGITDRYGSTTRSDRYPLVYGTSLLWDKDMKVKPAYSALQRRLQQTLGIN